MLSQVEEDFDTRLDWTGCVVLQSETKDGLTLDDVLLVVQGE